MFRYEIERLLEKADSRYTLIIATAKRARQINDYFNSVKKHEIPHVVPPQVELGEGDRKSTRLNSSHTDISRMPSSA